MKWPLGIAALVYTGGIVAAEQLVFPPAAALCLAFVMLALAVFRAPQREWFLWLALFFCGWSRHAVEDQIIPPHDLRRLFPEHPAQVRVRGVLRDAPACRTFEGRNGDVLRSSARLDVTDVHLDGQWRPACGAVAANTPGEVPADVFFEGRAVETGGVIRRPRPPAAEGLFDYRNYLERTGVFHELNVSAPEEWRVMAGQDAAPPWTQRFSAWAKSVMQHGLGEEDESLRLIWAMTLGWKTGLTDEVSEPFMRSGTMHLFAISGLHIAMISGILRRLFGLFRLPRAACGLGVIPLIWFYTAATGWQPSAMRATVMMSVVLAGWAMNRPGNLLNSLGAAALLILLWEPAQLFQAGFQLSFFVVLSIGLLMPVLERIWRRWLEPDPFLPEEARPRWRRALDAPLRWTASTFAVSLAAWIGSLPLIACYFNLFTPAGLMANMVVVPLGGLALMSSLGGLACGGLAPPLTEAFNAAAWFFMKLMVAAGEWFSRLPGGCFYVRAPSAAGIAVFYGLAFGAMTGLLWHKKHRKWAWPALLAAAGILAFQSRQRDVWKITVLPLSGGEAVLADAPGRRNDLLVDCGNESSVKRITRPFLRSQGVNRLPALVFTHGDMKNVGGAGGLSPGFTFGRVFTSPVAHRSPVYRALRRDLKQRPDMSREIRRGDRLGAWTVLHPDAGDKFPQADDGPLVLRGEMHGTRVLLLSDLSRAGQRLLLEREHNLQADIVVTGLPRNSEPLIDDLFAAVRPKLVIVTDTDYPATERAPPHLRKRLASHGVPVIYCRDSGAVTLSIRPSGWTWKTAWETGQRPQTSL